MVILLTLDLSSVIRLLDISGVSVCLYVVVVVVVLSLSLSLSLSLRVSSSRPDFIENALIEAEKPSNVPSNMLKV